MENIYLKDYRSIKNANINVSNINFFVGDNNSSKTSTLKLIRIINENKSLDFFDTFLKELNITSFTNKKKKTFWYGYRMIGTGKNPKNIFEFCKVSTIDSYSKPLITEIITSIDDENCNICKFVLSYMMNNEKLKLKSVEIVKLNITKRNLNDIENSIFDKQNAIELLIKILKNEKDIEIIDSKKLDKNFLDDEIEITTLMNKIKFNIMKKRRERNQIFEELKNKDRKLKNKISANEAPNEDFKKAREEIRLEMNKLEYNLAYLKIVNLLQFGQKDSSCKFKIETLFHLNSFTSDSENVDFFYLNSLAGQDIFDRNLMSSTPIDYIEPLRPMFKDFYTEEEIDKDEKLEKMHKYLSVEKKSKIDNDIKEKVNIFLIKTNMAEKVYFKKFPTDFNKDIITPIYIKNNSEKPLSICGTGISQILPILVYLYETFWKKEEYSVLMIEQPEIHLHPKAQAEFGTELFKNAFNNTQFFIETHSNYLVERILYETKKAIFHNEIVTISLFKNENDNVKVSSIKVNNQGELIGNKEDIEYYFDFFINENLKLL